MSEGVAHLIDTSYTLYRCTPLLKFGSGRRPFHVMENQIGKRICKALDLVIDSGNKPIPPQPQQQQQRAKGRIYRLRIRPFELEGYDYDESGNDQPPLKFELEYQYYHESKSKIQTFIMLPSKKNTYFSTSKVPPPPSPSSPANERQQRVGTDFWFYPLILARLSKPVLGEIKEVFENFYKAQVTPFHMPQKMMRYVVNCYAETFYDAPPSLEHNFPPVLRATQRSTELRLEYITSSNYAKYISFVITFSEVQKMCRLSGDPESFISCFEHHILKKTGINLDSCLLSSVASLIGLFTNSDKIKFQVRTSESDVYKILNALGNIASTEGGGL